MLHNDQLEQWERENFFDPSTQLADSARRAMPQRVVTGGEGTRIHTRDGKQLLGAFAGLYCVNVGYGRSEISETIADRPRLNLFRASDWCGGGGCELDAAG